MVASRHGYFAIVRYLVASGAHVHIQNEVSLVPHPTLWELGTICRSISMLYSFQRGHTAEVIAHLSCHTDIENYLHSCGALY